MGMCSALHSGFTDMCKATALPGECLFSEPTAITQEQPEVGGVTPDLRLDFALANSVMTSSFPALRCVIQQDDDTNVLSDHFPIICQWT